MLEKLCRICPNTASWERPTGNKEESGGFAGANGFGIEEWLTRKEWLLSGYRECPAYILLYQFSPKDTGQSKVK